MIHNAIEHSALLRSMANPKSAQHGAAQPLARYIAVDTFNTASARRPIRCRENVSTLHISIFLSGFVGRSCYVSRPPRRYLTWRSRAGTTCFHVSRPPRGVSNMVVPSWNHVFSRVQATQVGYLTWWPRAGTTCFHVSRPSRGGVSKMVFPSWNHVFSRVQATQRGYLTWWP